jgi:hypothetical protein
VVHTRTAEAPRLQGDRGAAALIVGINAVVVVAAMARVRPAPHQRAKIFTCQNRARNLSRWSALNARSMRSPLIQSAVAMTAPADHENRRCRDGRNTVSLSLQRATSATSAVMTRGASKRVITWVARSPLIDELRLRPSPRRGRDKGDQSRQLGPA